MGSVSAPAFCDSCDSIEIVSLLSVSLFLYLYLSSQIVVLLLKEI